MNQTLEQRRAHHAYEAVEAFLARKPNEEERKKYGTHVRKLPTRIAASGLGQALAFMVAKGYCPDILQALNHWILAKRDTDALLLEVIRGDSDNLRLRTAEALAYLQWLSRFAEAKKLTDNLAESTP